MSSTISRVLYWMTIYLVPVSPPDSSDLPESTTGRRIAFRSVLLRVGFTCAPAVTSRAVSSYLAFPPIQNESAVYFCCTSLGVASTGRYPALCPVKPGLSSPTAFRHMWARSSVLLINDYFIMQKCNCKLLIKKGRNK